MDVVVPGKPMPKQRPRMVRGRIWTPSTPHEEALAKELLSHQGEFKGVRRLSLVGLFYGADPRADGDNLLKLVADAVVRAGVIDNDNWILHGEFTKLPADHLSNPTPGRPCTRIAIREYSKGGITERN
jgi:Holliday junction resolvase RusA-like endonuclease